MFYRIALVGIVFMSGCCGLKVIREPLRVRDRATNEYCDLLWIGFLGDGINHRYEEGYGCGDPTHGIVIERPNQ